MFAVFSSLRHPVKPQKPGFHQLKTRFSGDEKNDNRFFSYRVLFVVVEAKEILGFSGAFLGFSRGCWKDFVKDRQLLSWLKNRK